MHIANALSSRLSARDPPLHLYFSPPFHPPDSTTSARRSCQLLVRRSATRGPSRARSSRSSPSFSRLGLGLVFFSPNPNPNPNPNEVIPAQAQARQEVARWAGRRVHRQSRHPLEEHEREARDGVCLAHSHRVCLSVAAFPQPRLAPAACRVGLAEGGCG